MLTLRLFLIFLIAFFIFVAFTTKTFWIQWSFVAFITGVALLLTELFGDEESFANSPNYDHWKQLKESRLLDFEFESSSKEKRN